jgi:3-methyladenine DNA glycosylase AlkD
MLTRGLQQKNPQEKKVTDLLLSLRKEFKKHRNPAQAKKMQAYMKSQIPYLGLPMALTRTISRSAFKELKFLSNGECSDAILHVWNGAQFREEKYAALELLKNRASKPFRDSNFLPLYKHLIVTGAWWDLVDEVATHYYAPLLNEKKVVNELKRFSQSDNLWLRRTAIIAQVLSGPEIQLPFLFEMIEPAIHEKEFFLRKAIGWGLRTAAEEHSGEVRKWLRLNEKRLSGLSLREAEKGFSQSVAG